MVTTPPVELAAPLTIDATGSFATISGPQESAEQHLHSLVGTSQGERVMRGDYGTELLQELFSGMNNLNYAAIKETVMNAITTWVPEVSLLAVDVATDPSSGTVSLTVRYALANDVEQSTTIVTQVPTN